MEDLNSHFGTFRQVADEITLSKLEENMEFFIGNDLRLKVKEYKSLLDLQTIDELHEIHDEKTNIFQKKKIAERKFTYYFK